MTTLVMAGRSQHPLTSWFVLITCLIHMVHSNVADVCDSAPVETAAHLIFNDGVERKFISNGPYYWFINVTDELPDARSALKIPYDFRPDVAVLKDTRNCRGGNLSLLLIQMKRERKTNEAEWLTLEMRIGNWYDNETGPIFWSQVNKIGHCELDVQICTTTDNYFATMSFDFKKKLDSAFGTIGDVAYFIQGTKIYKVVYKDQCISNPYKQVLAYSGVEIGTTTTAALSSQTVNGTNVIIFDHDVHVRLSNVDLDDITIGNDASLSDISRWKENANYFFRKCPLIESTFSFLLVDVFSSSKRHYYKKRIVLITLSVILACIFAIIMAIVFFNMLHRSKDGSKGRTKNNELDTKLGTDVDIKLDNGENGEQEKTLLQTSC